MLKIRFTRRGKKHQSFFRIIINDTKKAAKSGYFLEKLGFYNPITKESSLNKERIKYWLSKGAKLSDTVHNLLVKKKVIEGTKIDVHKKSKKKKGKQAESSPKEAQTEPAKPK